MKTSIIVILLALLFSFYLAYFGLPTISRFEERKVKRSHVINLDFMKDRLQKFNQGYYNSDLAKIPLRRTPAVDGRLVDYTTIVHPDIVPELEEVIATNRRKRHDQLTPGGVGCYLSHVKCWREASFDNDVVLIFEDDARLPPKTLDVIENLVQYLDKTDPEWDILLLGYESEDKDSSQKVKRLSNGFLRLHAYVVNNPKRLYGLFENYRPKKQIDWELSDKVRSGEIKAYGVGNDLIHPRFDDDSTIQTPPHFF